MHTIKHWLTGLSLLLLLALSAQAQQTDSLRSGFLNPPNSARPRTWWHWVGSNITKEGITKDLEWMKRVGIGGFQAFDVSLGTGQTVEKKILFFSPEWLDAIRHTAAEADRLGLEMTMATSAGWSETGGPWVKPEEAVKKVVWSELNLRGGQKFSGKLPQPPSVNGPIRNLPRSVRSAPASPDPTFYRDISMLAYRTPAAEASLADRKPTVTTSFGTIEPAVLWDDDLTTKVTVPTPAPGKTPWIQYAFDQPFTARAFSLALAQASFFGSTDVRAGRVQVSDDGQFFRTLLTFPGPQHDIRALPVRTFAFPATTARYFRIEFVPGGGLSTVGTPNATAANFGLTEAVFHGGARVHRWEDKANFAPMFAFEHLATPGVPDNAAIAPDAIVDLTGKIGSDGSLSWDVPPGNWTILRMGYSLTGAKNSPAVSVGVGFEVDKLSRKHLTSYYRQYTAPIAQVMGPLYGKGLQYWLADSYEADAQNWTDELIEEFRKRRGYDPTPYLPVLAGRVVRSADISDRFLWDYRRTLADLLAENHYAAITELAHKDGIKVYSEAAGISMPVIQDALMNKGRVDIPMGEFGMTQGLGSGADLSWRSPADLDNDHAYRGASDRLNAHQADVREAASAAHIYGKPIIAAEAWTGGGYEAPAAMKLIGDYWLTQGLNRLIFHTSTHQPLDTKPGNAMVGAHIHRNITWAEQAAPFMTYLSRNQFLLQQGRFVADLAYYTGEGIPSGVPYWEKIKPEPPAGYDYDFLNTEILLDKLSVQDGQLVLPTGMRYRVLMLPETDQMTPRVLQKIRQLVADGATVLGPKPSRSPSLAGYPAADAEVTALANEIWGDADGKLVFHHAYGKGQVFWGAPITSVLAEGRVAPDVAYTKPHTDTYLSWIHRRTPEAGLYFLVNLRNQTEPVRVTFRVDGKVPELWHADTGVIEPVSYTIANGLTTVPLTLLPEQSVFVVFRKAAGAPSFTAPQSTATVLRTLEGPWDVRFPPKLGAPEQIQLATLDSWTNHADEGVKFFGGTATYSRTLSADKAWFRSGGRLVLDLGAVYDLAEVLINGKSAGLLWKKPYRLDVTNYLKPGANQLEVRVTNQWTNRITGDRGLPADKRILSGSGFSFGPPTTTLKPSGMMGPIKIELIKN